MWLFGLVCYCQDTEVSKQATYLLLSELEKTPGGENYSPTPEDIINMFEDYGEKLEDHFWLCLVKCLLFAELFEIHVAILFHETSVYEWSRWGRGVTRVRGNWFNVYRRF